MKYSFLYFQKSIKMLHYYFKLPFIFTGLYAIKIEKSDADAVVTSRPKIYSILNVVVVCLVIIGCLILRLALIHVTDILLHYSFGFAYCCVSLLGLMSTVSFAYKSDLYVILLNRLDEFDNELKKLHIVVTNTAIFWLPMIYIIAVPVILLSLFMGNRSVEKKLLDFFAGLLPMAIRATCLTSVTIMLTFLYQRCSSINQFLEELDDTLLEENINDSMTSVRKDIKLGAEQNAAHILAKITELLDQLVEATKLMKDIFSFIIFVQVSFNIGLCSCSILIALFFSKFSEMSMFEYIMLVFVFTVQAMTIYILCFLLETETRNIYITLGQMNIYYLTPKLALMKNTLLLQGLHSKVDMNLFGIMPLRPATFLKQFNVCQTIMLSLLQIYQKSYKT